MVKFVDLNTGNIFDGTPPYVFWFDNEQSTDIIYTKSIGILSNKQELNISIDNNDVFKLIDSNKLNTISSSNFEKLNTFNVCDYNNLITSNYLSIGEQYLNDYFFHILYISASCKSTGEYKEIVNIDGYDILIGADFYDENESLNINLINFGVEIPDSIQKAIYESNVYEDKKDNILINRKFKELISNYWDMLANKGSYKSLINTLKWFEYGDIVKLKEIWKHNDNLKTFYKDEELSSIMTKKYSKYITDFIKTTFYGLYLVKEQLCKNDEFNSVIYDDELNPKIEYISKKWSWHDMMLKMSLLGNFYETYFMPIHLNLIHCTIEDIVFTNTFKILKNIRLCREDFIGSFESVWCNIQDTDNFIISNVYTTTNNNVPFGIVYKNQYDYDNIIRLGVDSDTNSSCISPISIDDYEDSKTIISQIYSGPGVVVPVVFRIPIYGDSFIKKEQVYFIPDTWNDWHLEEFYQVYKKKNINDKYIEITANLLCTKEKQYEFRFSFESSDSKIYTKIVKFNTIDTYHSTLNVYKVLRKKEEDINQNTIYNSDFNKYFFRRQPNDTTYDMREYTQYLNYNENSDKSIGLTHMLVVKTPDKDITNNYFIYDKPIKTENFKLCLSKKFGKKTKFINSKKSKFIFVPQFHDLVLLNGNTLDDYTIIDETLCVIPDFKYAKNIVDFEWIFENSSTHEKIYLKSSKEPFIAKTDENKLSNGFYNIIFKYSLSDGNTKEIKLNSAFLKK